jgi:hypothetical protein
VGELKKDIQVVTKQGEVHVNLTLTIRIENGCVVAGVEAGTPAARPLPPMPPDRKPGLVMDEDDKVIPDLGEGGEMIDFGKED